MASKFLHTRIRVSNLQRSIDWYCTYAGFRVTMPPTRSPAGNEIVMLELPGNAHGLELTYSPSYKLAVPEDLVHTCIGVDDIVTFCDGIEKKGGAAIWPDNWRKTFTSGGLKMAFLTDPDGYELEILEN
jgi:lactoylglutathione lyase